MTPHVAGKLLHRW
jgi:hypothetical protein